MKVAFVTTNTHKFKEVQDILKDYPIELEHLDMEYEENHDASLEEIARGAAKKLADQLQRPVVVEDTGLFFEAYENFPGALSKFVITTLGYKGIFKLLEGESRKVYFKTVAAFCQLGEEPKLFTGIMRGEITEDVHNEHVDVMPYDRIFIPEREAVTISDMTMEKKNSLSQRARAFRKFGKYMEGLGDKRKQKMEK